MPERVIVEIEQHIARVTLNRPDKHNALDREMFEALIAGATSLAENRAVRAVVLTGAGPTFCAGIDVAIFRTPLTPAFGPEDLRMVGDSGMTFFQAAALAWRRLPVPVIAAVRGAAFGAGPQIAMGADLRVATADSRWSVMEARWGLIPDMGLSVTARGLLRPDDLKKLAFTAAVIDGTEARSRGLVTDVHEEPLEAALAMAREIAIRSPDAIRACKSLLNAALDDATASLSREAALQAALLRSRNHAEAVAATLENRVPEFGDPDGGFG